MLNFGSNINEAYDTYKSGTSAYDSGGSLVTSLKSLAEDFSDPENALERNKRLNSNIYKFKNKFQDISRTNLFLIEMSQLPLIFDKDSDGNVTVNEFLQNMGLSKESISKDFLTLLCTSAPIPSKSINISKIKYSGLQITFPGTMDYDSVSFKFLVDMDMKVLAFFNVWMSAITGRINNKMNGLEYLDNIKSKIRVVKLNKENKRVYTTELESAFPISISEITNDTEIENADVITVKFAYIGENLSENSNVISTKKRRGLIGRLQKISSSLSSATSGVNNFKLW